MQQIKDIFMNQYKEHNIIRTLKVNEKEHKTFLFDTAKEMCNKDYIFTPQHKVVMNLLFNYFTGSEKCENLNLNLNKGILLVGNPGSGKTLIMNLFKFYTYQLGFNSFQMHQAQSIITQCNITGVQHLDNYGLTVHNPITCYIDDIANTNESINNFGTKINVIEHLLDLRHLVLMNRRKLTHVSTNIYPAAMEASKIYDSRIISRFAEMFNVIELVTDKDFRKP